MPLRVAIVHYHLKRGGVTRVIESTLRGFDALEEPPACAVLTGELPAGNAWTGRARRVEGLEYSNAGETAPAPVVLLSRLREAARTALGGEPDVWHIHNHSLGKNSAMPGVVSLLAEDGERVLLQMHDFAEDGRPENFRLNLRLPEYARTLYPAAPHIHYAVINARDHAIFLNAGLAEGRLHLLSNPVGGPAAGVDSDAVRPAVLDELGAERLVLYPVRAVRRKNFGELLLWAALAPPGTIFATTLGPTNRNYEDAYRRWKSFAARHQLPVRFAVAEESDRPFAHWMAAADRIVTTSIAEGFGLAFLEPWLHGKAIVGRDLPAITAGFKDAGLTLDGLYEQLAVPLDWIDSDSLERKIRERLIAAYAAYHSPLPPDGLARALQTIQPRPGKVDFAGLDESLQEQVIEHLLAHPEAREALPEFPRVPGEAPVAANARTVTHHYGLLAYARRLVGIYRMLARAEAPKPGYLDPADILRGFLEPENFRLLRT